MVQAMPQGGREALLPCTGEGARRADEGARAQRSVPLTSAPGAGEARAARCARALIRRCAPPSPAGGRRAGDRLPTAQPFTEAGKGWGTADLPEQPFSRLQEKGWSRQRRKVEEKPFSRLREKGWGSTPQSSTFHRGREGLGDRGPSGAALLAFAGEGMVQAAPHSGREALLPFTGEGARRADEGARAQRSGFLASAPGAGRARAARCARALIRRCAPPSPAAQEKGWSGRRGRT
jgi:hypothetical protein